MGAQDDQPSIDRIADLQQLISNFAGIKRVLNLADSGRSENDAEHSYGLALTCLFLAPKLAPELDLTKILTYALCHDLVEIHSGDTFIFDKAGTSTKKSREESAVARLEQEWPDFSVMTEATKRYLHKADEEATFVYTVDKILPCLMINLGEKDAYWKHHKITRQMLEENKKKTMSYSKYLKGYDEKLFQWLLDPDYYYKPDTKSSSN